MDSNEMIKDINKEFFDNLLKEIHDVVMVDLITAVGDTNELVDSVKVGINNDEGALWIENLNNLTEDVKGSLEVCYSQVENEFNKLFAEWEEYKKANEGDKEDSDAI